MSADRLRVRALSHPVEPVTTARERSVVTTVAAWCAAGAGTAALLLLSSLHALSPEFDPSYRMVSEYANGRYGWVLTLFFAMWALGSIALAVAIRRWLRSRWGKIGLALLVVAGIGQGLAVIFDVNHDPGHSIAGLLGIGALPPAAILISGSLTRTERWSQARKPMLWMANLTWASVVLLVVTFAVFIATYIHAGGDTSTPAKVLPPGVVALVGWANRLLVLVYNAWTITVAWYVIRFQADPSRAVLARA